MSFAGKWMELENMLSEMSQTQKDKYHIFSPLHESVKETIWEEEGDQPEREWNKRG
jgi:hypothetical protein